jgi:uncharacterized protein YqjF (DUF2071 family)
VEVLSPYTGLWCFEKVTLHPQHRFYGQQKIGSASTFARAAVNKRAGLVVQLFQNPMPRIFLTAQWRNLLMANYAIEPDVLKPYLPCYTELDTFEGVHYVSLVGFLFKDTRVHGIPVPFHTTFEEVNLRFYVRYKEGGEWKRGVVFLKRDRTAPSHIFCSQHLVQRKLPHPRNEARVDHN